MASSFKSIKSLKKTLRASGLSLLLLPDTLLAIWATLLYVLRSSLFFTMNWVGLGIRVWEIEGGMDQQARFYLGELSARRTMNYEHPRSLARERWRRNGGLSRQAGPRAEPQGTGSIYVGRKKSKGQGIAVLHV